MAEAADPAVMFENGLRRQAILLPCCRSCGRFHWYPMARCPYCLSAAIDWKPVGGPATVFTCSTVEHAFDRDWTSEIPYTVALIEFADAPGVRLVARLEEDRPGSIPVGATVEPVFGLSEHGASLRFRIAAEARGPSG